MKTKLLYALALLCGGQLAQAQYGPVGSAQGTAPAAPLQRVQFVQNADAENGSLRGGTPPPASNFVYQRMTPGGPAASNFQYQRCNYPPPYGVDPYQGHIYANGYPPAAVYGPQEAPSPYPPAPAPLPAYNPHNPYRHMAAQIEPPIVIRRPEPVYRGPAQMDEPIPFHRPCKETFWVSANYLAAVIRSMRIPPLLTTGSAGDFPPGALGGASTNVVVGDNIDFKMFSGVQLEAGIFLDEKNRFSVDWRGFMLFANSQTFTASSDATGNPVIARPIIFSFDNLEHVALISFPNELAGTISIESRSQMAGLELNGRWHNYHEEHVRTDCLFGLRYMRLSERLRISEGLNPLQNDAFLTFQGQPTAPPDRVTVEDLFDTKNDFFGVQIGGRMSCEYKFLSLDAFAKVALGATVEQANIHGSTTLTTATSVQTAAGGLLALANNSGNHSRTTLGFIPEFGANLGINITDHIRLQLGYSGLLWNRVLRPGAQIDRNVNPGLVPRSNLFGTVVGPTSPVFQFNDEFFWAHTFKLGVELHY